MIRDVAAALIKAQPAATSSGPSVEAFIDCTSLFNAGHRTQGSR
jgi:hypothetical protein